VERSRTRVGWVTPRPTVVVGGSWHIGPVVLGVAYLCAIPDQQIGRIIGYTVADQMLEELVVAALLMVFFTKTCQTRGIVFPSDRGSQFIAKSVDPECTSKIWARSDCWERRVVPITI